MNKKEIILILHNIRSVQNVGAIFRTADAIGVSGIILSGYTPTPLDRFGRIRSDMAKTALGAEKSVSWKYVKTLGPTIKQLKKDNFEIVSVEQSEKSVDYKIYRSKNKVALIFGNEVRGISNALINLSDKTIDIPMRGKKESLNVSVSAGIILYRLFDL